MEKGKTGKRILPQPKQIAAHIYINAKIDDLLTLEECVYRENDAKKHHQMRIKAKKLRYTMEIFKDLYKTGLQEEISEMKSLQDLLGEMHDCDLWIESLPQLMTQARQKTLLEDSTLDPASRYPGIIYFTSRLIRSLQRERKVMRTEGESTKFLSDLRERRKNLGQPSFLYGGRSVGVFSVSQRKQGNTSSAETGPLKIVLTSTSMKIMLQERKKTPEKRCRGIPECRRPRRPRHLPGRGV